MFENAKAVLFDLDGTVYHGNQVIAGANEAIEHCRDSGKRVFFLTNNSAKSRREVCEKLNGMGVPCGSEEVVTSGYASGLLLLEKGITDVYVCGTESLRGEIGGLGVRLAEAGSARNLLIGYDPSFDYEKCTAGMRAALVAERIVACNKERGFRGERAAVFPGCGAMVAAIEWCAGKQADYLVGKPNTLMLEILCEEHGYTREEVVMVGDTYESDIVMADRFGCGSVLVGASDVDGVLRVRSIGDMVNLI